MREFTMTLAEFARLIGKDERAVKQMVIQKYWPWAKAFLTDSGKYIFVISRKGFENEYGNIETESEYDHS